MIIAIPVSTSKIQYFINQAYVDYVIGAGMEPVLVSPNNDLDVMANVCDGLILPGGIDVDPTFYGENNIASYLADIKKDNFEREALYAFINAGKPVFGICRGFQIIIREYLKMNPHEEAWLEYWQHTPHHSLVDELNIPRTSYSHKVSYWSSLYGKGRKRSAMFVNSMHHQVVVMTAQKEPEDSSIRILARTKTGISKKSVGYVVEAFRIETDKVKVLAVQWHPEELKDYKLIQTFFGVEVSEGDAPKTASQKALVGKIV